MCLAAAFAYAVLSIGVNFLRRDTYAYCSWFPFGFIRKILSLSTLSRLVMVFGLWIRSDDRVDYLILQIRLSCGCSESKADRGVTVAGTSGIAMTAR